MLVRERGTTETKVSAACAAADPGLAAVRDRPWRRRLEGGEGREGKEREFEEGKRGRVQEVEIRVVLMTWQTRMGDHYGKKQGKGNGAGRVGRWELD